HARARLPRDRHDAGDRPHRELRAHGEHEIRAPRRALRAREVPGNQALTERDRGSLENSAARAAGRVRLARPHAREHTLGRRALAAGEAEDLAQGPVDLDHALGRGARREVQPIDVLGDQRVELASALEGHERQVPGVRLGLPRGRLESAPPGAPADVGVDEVVLERRELLGAGRSVEAHARITKLVLDEARALPGVVAAWSAAELPEAARPMPSAYGAVRKGRPWSQPILAKDRVRYVGEPVAVVVAESPYRVADALELARVGYEPLPALATVEASLASPTRVHDGWPDNTALGVSGAIGD